MRRTAMKLFVVAAITEAFSWLALLISMVVKYGPPENEIGVKIFGPIHGALFVFYGVLVLLVSRLGRWSLPVTAVALLASIPPFTTLLFERWARRRGLLTLPEAVTPEPDRIAVG